ncbi:MAG: alpha-1,2-fucosyltransferase [Methanobrevibacter sp.]|uniref:alpha-1,2-fucosyltransferase n=1 Tax=Methanobrevibacter sp. TaxID=66852 RepID=UPI002E792081|nr:alpha-1,2-fucosyltransferase [Methanobrevibacter sp.]MEE0935630.1 alpha-1,2-fucosyltransferase [Methanobrevibacter sp.]
MIFVDIRGDLGDQLFQYATARSLSIDKNTDFLMNIRNSDAKNENSINFKLNHFNIDCDQQINETEINDGVLEVIGSDNFINFNEFSGDIYLKGNWENENYFKHNKLTIRNDFSVITSPNKKNRNMLDEINGSESVCLSFRCNEYSDSYFLAQFGMCTEEYYKNAINFMAAKVKNPTFYVFCDDDWMEDNVKLDFPMVYVNCNDVGKEYEELRLMYSCQHFILDNSNLSWWGAWLGNCKNKIVFAPTPWFNNFKKQSILCPEWIQLRCDRSDLFKKSNKKVFELVTNDDLNKIEYVDFKVGIGKWGISLQSQSNHSSFKFKSDFKFIANEHVVELKLCSKKDNLITLDYNDSKKIVLGYRKGHSVKYVHFKDINLNDLIFEINDDTLVIEDFTIKSVDSNFNLLM